MPRRSPCGPWCGCQVGWDKSASLIDKRLGDERKIQLGSPLLNERMLVGPGFTIFCMAAKVDGSEVVVVAAALPISLSNLDFGELAGVELLELGQAVVFSLSKLEVRGANVGDIVRGGHIGEASVIELRERSFHVDGNGLRESSKGVKVGHDAKRSQLLFHGSAAAGVCTRVKKKQ